MCLLGPFFHAMGSVIAILTSLHHGTTVVVPDYTFNPEKAVTVSSSMLYWYRAGFLLVPVYGSE